MSGSVIKGLAALGVSIHWLFSGEGEMNSPLHEEVARINALIKYWEATGQLLAANLERARAEVAAKYGEGAAAEIFDGLMPGRIPSVAEGNKVIYPQAVERVQGVSGASTVAEPSKEKKEGESI